MSDEVKTCKKCSRVLSVTRFSNNKTMKDGRLSTCKDCVNVYKAILRGNLLRWAAPNKLITRPRSYVNVAEGMKWCKQCARELSNVKFSTNTTSWDGFYYICRECDSVKRALREGWLLRWGVSPPTGHRTCTRCYRVLPFTQFYKSVKGRGGILPVCKCCKSVSYAIKEGKLLSWGVYRHVPDGIKHCTNCDQDLSLDSFARSGGERLQSYCKACVSDYNKAHGATQAVVNAFSNYLQCARCSDTKHTKEFSPTSKTCKECVIEVKYRLPVGEKRRMLEACGYACEICGSKEPRHKRGFVIDHCHNTGSVRGILCNWCNTGLGRFGDNLEGLMRAVQYLSLQPREIPDE